MRVFIGIHYDERDMCLDQNLLYLKNTNFEENIYKNFVVAHKTGHSPSERSLSTEGMEKCLDTLNDEEDVHVQYMQFIGEKIEDDLRTIFELCHKKNKKLFVYGVKISDTDQLDKFINQQEKAVDFLGNKGLFIDKYAHNANINDIDDQEAEILTNKFITDKTKLLEDKKSFIEKIIKQYDIPEEYSNATDCPKIVLKLTAKAGWGNMYIRDERDLKAAVEVLCSGIHFPANPEIGLEDTFVDPKILIEPFIQKAECLNTSFSIFIRDEVREIKNLQTTIENQINRCNVGNQTNNFLTQEQEIIDNKSKIVEKIIAESGYVGDVGIDYMVDRDNELSILSVVEVNPRSNGSSRQEREAAEIAKKHNIGDFHSSTRKIYLKSGLNIEDMEEEFNKMQEFATEKGVFIVPHRVFHSAGHQYMTVLAVGDKKNAAQVDRVLQQALELCTLGSEPKEQTVSTNGIHPSIQRYIDRIQAHYERLKILMTGTRSA